MKKISKSPERHTFQLESAKKRAEEDGTEVSKAYIEMWEDARQQDEKNIANPEWQKNNLEFDLRSTDWILTKVRSSDRYAQNLYAAMCNMEFIKNEVWPLIRDQRWSCSWRYAGGIIADMQEKGDYIDWYCSGIGPKSESGFVSEGTVTDEVLEDLRKLGWSAVEWEES